MGLAAAEIGLGLGFWYLGERRDRSMGAENEQALRAP
jgi:hypothetical protein